MQSAKAALSGTLLGRLVKPTPAEVAVQSAVTRLKELLNEFRAAYGATGFRGSEALDNLIAIGGKYGQNPGLTLALVNQALQESGRMGTDLRNALGARPDATGQNQNPVAVNPRGQKLQWDGKAWIPIR